MELNKNHKHFNQNNCDFYLQLTFRTFNSPVEKNILSELNCNQVYCEACETTISKCLHNLTEHFNGKRHKSKIDFLSKSAIVHQLLEENNDKNDTIIGLEYVIELVYSPKSSDIFICSLCKEHNEKQQIINHLKSLSHVEKYLEKHFPLSYAKVIQYLGSYDEIKKAFLRLLCVMIEKEAFYKSMQPSVFFYKDFDLDPLKIYDLTNSKLHQKETLKFQLAVTEEIIQLKTGLVKEPVMNNFKTQNSLKRLHTEDGDDKDDVVIIEPKIPKIDLACDSSDEEEQPKESMVQTFLEATKGFFSNLDSKKIQELKSSVEKVSKEVIEPKPALLIFTDAEVEFLMINFEKIGDAQQKNLLNFLYHLQRSQPERFKMLRSPF